MTTSNLPGQTVRGTTASDEADRLAALYDDFAQADLAPLWTQVADVTPQQPQPTVTPAVWRWSQLLPLAERAAQLVPVGRGGERRAIALRNPGTPERPYATGTLWAAIQYLGPHEAAPAHRHTQSAFRFVIEGEGVWTNVDGDPVAMRRGDLLLTPGWHFHEHHNTTDRPMAWLDGLDTPLIENLDAGFFEFGANELSTTETPPRSRGERLWGQPGLVPVGLATTVVSPLAAYRWGHTDAALAAQLEVEREGYAATAEPGHAAVRFTNPATGGDALRTMRTEMHRLAPGAVTEARRSVGSSVWQVFSGDGTVYIAGQQYTVSTGDVFAVPSWTELRLESDDGLDAFRFSDEPVHEALGLFRAEAVR